jgi:uncharacterized integral membrane protein (TIGR00698 family)
VQRLAPGIGLSFLVACIGFWGDPVLKAATGGRLGLPAMVIALVVGIALNSLSERSLFAPGIAWCVKTLLRYAIGLLGLRVVLGDILGLGLSTLLLVVVSMVATVAGGLWLARLLDRQSGYGALAGAACAVCGASATLATASVVPDYRAKSADIAFTVVAANAISTLAMLAYPSLCILLGLDARQSGILIGATIHDMAQVVGAGYAMSEEAGTLAVIVKLFRVFLLLPMVLLIGWWLMRQTTIQSKQDRASVPIPLFAVAFVLLACLNSAMAGMPNLSAALHYPALKSALGTASTWGLLIAISALGLGTSLKSLASIGWRHIAVFMGATAVILLLVLFGVLLGG